MGCAATNFHHCHNSTGNFVFSLPYPYIYHSVFIMVLFFQFFVFIALFICLSSFFYSLFVLTRYNYFLSTSFFLPSQFWSPIYCFHFSFLFYLLNTLFFGERSAEEKKKRMVGYWGEKEGGGDRNEKKRGTEKDEAKKKERKKAFRTQPWLQITIRCI